MLALWRFVPLLGIGTWASRAVQGDRPTLPELSTYFAWRIGLVCFIYILGWIDLKVGAFAWKKVDHKNRVLLFGLVCLGCGTFWVSLFGLVLGFGHG